MSDLTPLNDAPIPADDPARPLTLARPDADPALPHVGVVGDPYTTLLSGAQTAGKYCLIDMHVPPGGGPPPHRHNFEESFTLLHGQIEATCRDRTVTVRAVETAHVPANAIHSFTNATGQPARLLCLCAPAGQEEFFARIGVPVDGRTTPPPELDPAAQRAAQAKAVAIAAEYRTQLFKPK